MNGISEYSFQIILFITFTVFILIWLRSFFLTGIKKSSIYTHNEGFIAGFSFRITLISSVIAILVYLYNPDLMAWSSIYLHPYLRLFGLVVGISGLLLLVLAIRSLGKNFFATVQLRKNHELVKTGPYRYSRHPMYISFVLMWICFFLVSSNWFIGLTGVLTYIIIFLFRVPKEERMLRERFGIEYDKDGDA